MPATARPACVDPRRPRGLAAPLWSGLVGVVAALAMLLTVGAPAVGATGAPPGPTTTPAPLVETPPERDEAVPGPVVLLGVPGLRWDDVSPELPALWSLLREGAVGALSVRSVHTVACPVDGWLAVSSGSRAADVRPPLGCTPMWQPAGGQVGAWDRYVRQAREGEFGARPGLLGEQLKAAGADVAAVGPGAAIATADAEGLVVGDYRRGASAVTLPADVQAALAEDPELLVIDAGALPGPPDPPEPPDPAEPTRSGQTVAEQARAAREARVAREAQLRRVDALLATTLDAAGADATVIVAGLSDSGAAEAHLRLLAVSGPTVGGPDHHGFLGSASTRQQGLAQTTDLAPTLLHLLGIPAPTSLVGAPLTVVAQGPDSVTSTYAQVADLDAAAQAVKPLIPVFFRWLVYGQILFYGLAALALTRHLGGPSRRRRVLTWLRRVAVVLAAIPVSTFLANLVPWWRAGNDALAAGAVIALFALAITAVALAGPWRRRPLGELGAVAGITAGVLALDVVTGSRLQLSSIMGLQALVGGRFYGLGNQQFALFGVGAILLAAALAAQAQRRGRRRLAVAAVVAVGVLTVVIDGTPGLGSDFGGPPALIPAFAVLTLMVSGVRVSWSRIALVAVATVGAVTLLSVLDWLRPAADRTHLGRFVETVLTGGAGQVIERKLGQNLAIMFGSELSLLVPVVTLFVIAVLMRPVPWGPAPLPRTWQAAPALRPGLIACLVMVLIGMGINDSGTVVPAIGGTLAVPLLIAVCARTRMRTDEEAQVRSATI